MTDNNHPITPPPELVLQWLEESPKHGEFGISQYIATEAARWGADQELEACCEWLVAGPWFSPDGECIKDLRANRRPKPPSLKEQALTLLDDASDRLDAVHENTIRRALESLPS